MKKLGLLGGVGPESTIPYYRGIIYGVQKKVGRPYPNVLPPPLQNPGTPSPQIPNRWRLPPAE